MDYLTNINRNLDRQMDKQIDRYIDRKEWEYWLARQID